MQGVGSFTFFKTFKLPFSFTGYHVIVEGREPFETDINRQGRTRRHLL